MREYYAFITRSGGLAVRKRAGLEEFQHQMKIMRRDGYLGLFRAEDDDARLMAEELRDEYHWKKWRRTNDWTRDVVNKTLGGRL